MRLWEAPGSRGAKGRPEARLVTEDKKRREALVHYLHTYFTYAYTRRYWERERKEALKFGEDAQSSLPLGKARLQV
jgi:hypothetical protein